MTSIAFRKTLLVLLIGFGVVIAAGYKLMNLDEGYALIAGYTLFSLNYLMLARIYAGVVRVSATGEASAKFKTALAGFTFLKFVGLIGALFLLIILWKLPGLYLALGSLISLFLLTGLLMTTYLKSFEAPSR